MVHTNRKPALHLFQCEMKTKIINIICTAAMENINIIQSVYSSIRGLQGQRSPNHHGSHWTLVISGSSRLLAECTALLSRSPPASAQQSPRLWCWGHTCSHTSVSQHNMSSERFHSWYSSQPITSAVEENALPCPGIEPKWVRSVCPNSTEMTTNKRLFTPHLLYYTGIHNVPFISFKTFLWCISLQKKKNCFHNF